VEDSKAVENKMHEKSQYLQALTHHFNNDFGGSGYPKDSRSQNQSSLSTS
jgi:hypothetical protein